MGRRISELLDSAGGAKFQECLHALKTQEEWQGAIPVRRSDGIYRRIAFRSRRMELHGERPFILIHGMDVTEQHGRGSAAHRHAAARIDSRIGGRRHLRHRPRRAAYVH